MGCEQCCNRLGDVLDAGIGSCFPEAKPRIEAAFSEIAAILCETPCTITVPAGTLPADFIDEGWAGILPDPQDCPLLFVVEGCNIWAAPNNQTCDGGNPLGLQWCQICAPPPPPSGGGTTVQTSIIGNGNLTLIDSSNGNLTFGSGGQLVRRPITAVFHDDIGIVVAGNRFTLPAGTYDLQINVSTRVSHNSAAGDVSWGWDSFLNNVTGAISILQLSQMTRTGNRVGFTHGQYGRIRLVLASPTLFELATDRAQLGFFDPEFIELRAMRDEVYIQRFS